MYEVIFVDTSQVSGPGLASCSFHDSLCHFVLGFVLASVYLSQGCGSGGWTCMGGRSICPDLQWRAELIGLLRIHFS